MKKWILSSLVFLMSAGAQAGDILFIDINNVTPEIAVVENYLKQAKAQGYEKNTRLVVVPSYETFSPQQRTQLERLSLQIENLFKVGGSSNLDRIAKLGEQIRSVKTGSNNQEYTMQQLLAELKSVLANTEYKFDRVFISGHHSPTLDGANGVLGGEFLNGFSAEIAQTYLNNAPTTQNVHSLVLLGCYTGTPDMMGKAEAPWAAVLPKAVFHFGYNNPAPLKTDPVNLDILRRLISAQNLIANGESLQQLASFMGSIRTQGRFLGYRVGSQYIQHPYRSNK